MGQTEPERGRKLTVHLLDHPPPLTPRGARALLAILVSNAEEELGPDWRQHLHDEAE